jgi:hypothetical protein
MPTNLRIIGTSVGVAACNTYSPQRHGEGYTFAQVSGAVGMKVSDFYIQNRRGWVRPPIPELLRDDRWSL